MATCLPMASSPGKSLRANSSETTTTGADFSPSSAARRSCARARAECPSPPDTTGSRPARAPPTARGDGGCPGEVHAGADARVRERQRPADGDSSATPGSVSSALGSCAVVARRSRRPWDSATTAARPARCTSPSGRKPVIDRAAAWRSCAASARRRRAAPARPRSRRRAARCGARRETWLDERVDSLSDSCRSTREACSAGTRPKATLDTSETAAVTASTRPSMATPWSVGRLGATSAEQEVDEPQRQQDPGAAADDAEQRALGQKLAHDAPARRRRASSGWRPRAAAPSPAPASRPATLAQAMTSTQTTAHRQQDQRRPHRPDDALAQRRRVQRQVLVVALGRMVGAHRRRHGVEVGAAPAPPTWPPSAARPTTANACMPRLLRQRQVAPRSRGKGTKTSGGIVAAVEREAEGRPASTPTIDRLPPVERDGASDDLGIAAVAPLPERVREDDRLRADDRRRRR